jgi:ketosteroid isomerase-like protein
MNVFSACKLILPLVVFVAVSACARRIDLSADGEQLLQRDAEWADAAAAGKDLDKIVSYWSDDALVIEPGLPIYEGKAAIRGYVAASLQTPGFKIHWVSEKPVFSADGTMAYMRGVDEMTVPGPNGTLVTLHTRGISVWRRAAGGEWRCVVDIANEPPATRIAH